MQEELQVGDVVHLKSGGPNMVVTRIRPTPEPECECMWMADKGKRNLAAFPISALKIHVEENPLESKMLETFKLARALEMNEAAYNQELILSSDVRKKLRLTNLDPMDQKRTRKKMQ